MKPSENIKAFESAELPPSVIKKMKKLEKYLKSLSKTSQISPIFERIHRVLDDFMAKRVNRFLSCRKGCSYCCNNAVEILALEAVYISNKTNTEFRIGRHPVDHSSPCPFLKDNLCSIYEYRPLVCRTYGSLEPSEICEDPTATHALHNYKSSDFWFKTVFTWLYFNSRDIKTDEGTLETGKDIREWFGTIKPS